MNYITESKSNIVKVIKNNYIFILIIFVIIIMIVMLNITTTQEYFENKPKVVVSITTIPDRSKNIDNVLKNLSSFKNVDEIILNAPSYSDRFKATYKYPQNITHIPKVRINKCEDLGPVTKLLPTVELIGKDEPDTMIIILDDDINYSEDAINSIIKEKIERPNDIVCGKAWSYKKINDYIIPYTLPKGYNDILQGYGIVAFNRSMFDDDFSDYIKAAMVKHRSVDDLMISGYMKSKGINIYKIFRPFDVKPNLELQSSGLMVGNIRDMKQFKAIRELF